MIDVIDILKYALSGRSVPTSYGACIHIDADYAQIQYKLTMENVKEQTIYDVVYQFKLRRESLSLDEMTETQKKDTFRVAVFDEVLSTAYQDATQSQRLQKVIDTRNTAMISLSNLPLALKYHDDQIGAFGEVPIPLWDAGTIPSKVLELLKR